MKWKRVEIIALLAAFLIVAVASLLTVFSEAEIEEAPLLSLTLTLGAYLAGRVQFWSNHDAREKEWQCTRKHQERVEKLLGELAAGDGTKRKE